MNRQELELAKLELAEEKRILEVMRGHYNVALKRIYDKIEMLGDRNDLAAIRQRKYQQELAKEVNDILGKLESNVYGSLEQYLTESYEQGFVGTLYNLQKQGVPLAFRVDRESVIRAVTMTADSIRLSDRIHGNVRNLQRHVVAEITRGFADNAHVTEVAGHIATKVDLGVVNSVKMGVKGRSNQAFRQAMTISRTEKGRVKAESNLAAMYRAKDKGADVVKQWDSTMDSRTRPDHVKANGQIRELDEDFKVGNAHGPSPHKIGKAEHDINCRCVCLQRARAALEIPKAEKYTKWDGNNHCFVDLSDAKNYADFKKRYDALVEEPRAAKSVNVSKRTPKVDFGFIDSPTYRKAFDFFDDAKVADLACNVARKMLKHRNGTTLEDFAAISLSGRLVATELKSATTSKKASLSKDNIRVLTDAKRGDLVTVHNHPENMPPSFSDFKLCLAKSVRYGIIACHNGNVFRYRIVDRELFESAIADNKEAEFSGFMDKGSLYFGTKDGDAFITSVLERRYGVTYEKLE